MDGIYAAEVCDEEEEAITMQEAVEREEEDNEYAEEDERDYEYDDEEVVDEGVDYDDVYGDRQSDEDDDIDRDDDERRQEDDDVVEEDMLVATTATIDVDDGPIGHERKFIVDSLDGECLSPSVDDTDAPAVEEDAEVIGASDAMEEENGLVNGDEDEDDEAHDVGVDEGDDDDDDDDDGGGDVERAPRVEIVFDESGRDVSSESFARAAANRPSTASTARSSSPIDMGTTMATTPQQSIQQQQQQQHSRGLIAEDGLDDDEGVSLWHEDVDNGCDDIESRIDEEYAKFREEKEARSLSRPGTASRASSPTRQRSAERAASASKLQAIKRASGGGNVGASAANEIPRQTYVPRDRPSSAGRLMDMNRQYNHASLGSSSGGAGASCDGNGRNASSATASVPTQFLETLEEKNSFGSLRYDASKGTDVGSARDDAGTTGGSCTESAEEIGLLPDGSGVVGCSADDDDGDMRPSASLADEDEDNAAIDTKSESSRTTTAPNPKTTPKPSSAAADSPPVSSPARRREDSGVVGVSKRLYPDIYSNQGYRRSSSRAGGRPASAYSVLENVGNYYYNGSVHSPPRLNASGAGYRYYYAHSKGRRPGSTKASRPSTATAASSPYCSNAVLSAKCRSSAFVAPSRIAWGDVMDGNILGQINEANAISRMLHLRRRYKLVLNSPTTASVAVFDVEEGTGVRPASAGKQSTSVDGEVLMIETFMQAVGRLKQRLRLQYHKDKRLL